MTTHETINVRSAKTAVRCPFHGVTTTLTAISGTRREGTFGQVAFRYPLEIDFWMLFCGCVCSAEDWRLVTPTKADGTCISRFMPKASDPEPVRVCPVCSEVVNTFNLGNGLLVIKKHGEDSGILKYCSGSGSLVRSGTINASTNANQEDEKMSNSTQLNELRQTLQRARERRELEQKIDAAGVIVSTLDGFLNGVIVRFDKSYAACGGKPEGTYTYVAIKEDGRWYTTGSETGPMNADDLAAFMLAGQSVTSFQLLGEAANTFPVVLESDTAVSTPAVEVAQGKLA